MSRISETRKAIDMVADQIMENPDYIRFPACLAPILSDIAISLATIADAMTEGGTT